MNELLEIDEDDFYYLDYFNKCQNDKLGIFTTDTAYIEHLKCLREIIILGLKIKDPGIFSKYGWMKSKWNATLLKHKGILKSDVKIKELNTEYYNYFHSAELISDSM